MSDNQQGVQNARNQLELSNEDEEILEESFPRTVQL